MRKKTSKVIITESEVQEALRKFKKSGGLIRKLPSEISPRNFVVGGKYSAFEYVGPDMSVSETIH